jgi:hypothetical protein
MRWTVPQHRSYFEIVIRRLRFYGRTFERGRALKSERHFSLRSAKRTVAANRPSHAIDLEKLLRFSQQLYAHALTLQEVVRNKGKVTYEVLRPGYDRQAARQFEIFSKPPSRRSSGFGKRGSTAAP